MSASPRIEELKGIEEPRVEFLSIKWSEDDSMLAASCSGGLIRIYSTDNFHLSRVLSNRIASIMPITSITWKPNNVLSATRNTLLGTFSDGWATTWDATAGNTLETLKLPGDSAHICEYSGTGVFFAVGINDFTIKIYESEDFTIYGTLDCARGEKTGHSNKICSLKWVEDSTLISGGWDDTIITWDIGVCSPLNSIYGAHICGQALDLKKELLVAGCYSRKEQIQLYNYISAERITSISLSVDGKGGLTYACQFNKLGDREHFASTGTELYVFDSSTYEKVFSLSSEGHGLCLDWGFNENILAVGFNDGKIRIFKVLE